MKKNSILLVAGGTGGHLFPAEALSCELQNRGYCIHLVTDCRTKNFSANFSASTIHEIPSSQFSLLNPVILYNFIKFFLKGFFISFKIIRKIKPIAIIGFGGYPSLSPLFAGISLRIPSIIHEQNVIMGRANYLLSFFVRAIATGFFLKKNTFLNDKIIVTGNPVRASILKASSVSYQPSYPDQPFHLVIMGGSQGAQFFSKIVPLAISHIPSKHLKRLMITQQVRQEDIEEVQSHYNKLHLTAKISSFFVDIAEHIATAHLLICRSGASTVSEIAVIGRPSILVPYPYAVGKDQLANAMFLKDTGGAEVVMQSSLSPERLADILLSAMEEPERLMKMAKEAYKMGKPQSVDFLADVVEGISKGHKVSQLKRKN
ncbi:Undecaprenyl-PP-MurNAc-pentapeptide-UDPGlcNAc GlcNAc transferase [Liberibacter crescens BT-1]|uniref:UDP-N-acetylglucosamine--N-acetylmuramyl-(pentapeptide) pyrophosphoryl-undecaprenol N-acetylglucosamine transferase n=1 Tax=Liberibacter crescens (strain BT-1) TaxID=1215343 RepID=L0EVL0_LIBCB|nr:undecaprenyldiphospho-muramoylpentapeptide beta-N-acetylglucosaminyltransferase [Liberibacter crescens]AGA64703.1 Undecaprenyl-PP-MurNAc-pentapeptide-UDPGlcNAc GlcNAc transferase [Liberibacter crescens BT-1]AMC12796.1 UDP-diphospho-muramoylpentapeptide beta-N-acetylglucosaminyltransferase [Liberibacter crescens]